MSLVGFKTFRWGKSFGTMEDTRLGSINKGNLKESEEEELAYCEGTRAAAVSLRE